MTDAGVDIGYLKDNIVMRLKGYFPNDLTIPSVVNARSLEML